MKENTPTLLEIKTIIQYEMSGGKIMPHFYDFMEHNDEYMANLNISTNENIPQMIGQLVHRALRVRNEPIQFDQAIFFENQADHFFYGKFFMFRQLGSFFYFDDIKIGCMAIAASFGEEMMSMRFTNHLPPDKLN